MKQELMVTQIKMNVLWKKKDKVNVSDEEMPVGESVKPDGLV